MARIASVLRNRFPFGGFPNRRLARLLVGACSCLTLWYLLRSLLSYSTNKAYVNLDVYRLGGLTVASDVIGWIYFVAWSVSFYPQIYDNFKRKSVIGLNFDFLSLNVIGFMLYSFYNCGLYWISGIQDAYMARHHTVVLPVKVNDVFFGVHAVFACSVTIFQCSIYERGNQTVSRSCRITITLIFLFVASTLISSVLQALSWLDFLFYASYVKLFITIVKYVPQAYMNFARKSTVGWSIGNVILDFTGGTFSMGQMVLDSYNFDDWTSFFGDPTKFGLGLFSVMFDILFMLQHYVFFRRRDNSSPMLIVTTDDDEEEIVRHEEQHPSYGSGEDIANFA